MSKGIFAPCLRGGSLCGSETVVSTAETSVVVSRCTVVGVVSRSVEIQVDKRSHRTHRLGSSLQDKSCIDHSLEGVVAAGDGMEQYCSRQQSCCCGRVVPLIAGRQTVYTYTPDRRRSRQQ